MGRAEEEAQARDRVLGNPGSAVTRGCDHVLPGVRTGGGLDMRSVYMHVVVCICGFLCCVGHSVWPRGCMDSVSSLRAHTRDIQCACASTCGVSVERAGSVWSVRGLCGAALVCGCVQWCVCVRVRERACTTLTQDEATDALRWPQRHGYLYFNATKI